MADVASVYTNKKGIYCRRLSCSAVQATLNRTFASDSKGDSFPLDFNLQDVTHTIEVEISSGKYK